MAQSHGKDCVILAGGYALTGYANDVTVSREADTAETSVFGVAAKTYIPGLPDATMSVAGFWDGATGASDSILSTMLGTSGSVLTVAPAGTTLANRCTVLAGIETSYETSANLGDAVGISAEFQASGGAWAGVILHSSAAAETSSTNSTSVNNSAASTGGYVANLHALACAGTATIKVQQSSDNGVGDAWADLVTFTALTTSVAGEQKTGTGAVEQYLRVISTLGSTPSYTYAVAFARLP